MARVKVYDVPRFVPPTYLYRCKLDRVIDGDTVDLNIDLGFKTWTYKRIRLIGIDTPELRGGTAESKAEARIAKRRVEDLFAEADESFVQTQWDSKGKYGRTLGWLYVLKDEQVTNINILLLQENLAVESSY
jgi:endonuclease YncB( thermonuclease family)